MCSVRFSKPELVFGNDTVFSDKNCLIVIIAKCNLESKSFKIENMVCEEIIPVED